MNSLAIDTATTALGLCLGSDTGGEASHHRTLILKVGLKHSEKLMLAVRMLLGQAGLSPTDLDLIVSSTGPGSFTGIRIGLATAKGLADGASCRLIGISSLDGLAHRYRRFPGLVVAVNPSLRKKLYAAVYRAGSLEGNYLETTLRDLGTALKNSGPILITGAAAQDLYDLMLAEGAGPELAVDASEQSTDPEGLLACGMAKLGEPESEPVPLYLRKSEAEITLFGE
jgi:tRNA threonylcarbamoyladenosine biosynthesis protein TsaB